MNIQQERIENHQSRLSVTIDADRLEKAKKKAVRQISQEVNIPGFRKGKVPYKVLARYVGESYILESAVEEMGKNIYLEVLEESGVQPYGPGSIEDIQLEPEPVIVFSVPLMPEVELNDYRSIRVDFEVSTVTDEDVEKALKDLQQSEGLVEESHKPIAVGDRITVDIHSEFADGEELDDDDSSDDLDDDSSSGDLDDDDSSDDLDDDSSSGDLDDDDSSDDLDDDEDEPYIPQKGEPFFHRHEVVLNLVEDEEPILPGFIENMVGANVGDTVEFELEVPDDEDFEDIVGRKVHFMVDVSKIETVTLPDMNDDFAARVTQDEDEPLTLLQLRLRVRENLEKEAQRQAQSDHADEILTQIMEQAEIAYPNMMVEDNIDDLVKEFESSVLGRQGIKLEDYLKITGTSQEVLRENYREVAIGRIERSLTLGEILQHEKIRVDEDQITSQIEDAIKTIAKDDEQRESIRKLYEMPGLRDNLRNELMTQNLIERISLIGRGEAPELSELEQDDETEDDSPVADVEASVENDAEPEAEVDSVDTSNEVEVEDRETDS